MPRPLSPIRRMLLGREGRDLHERLLRSEAEVERLRNELERIIEGDEDSTSERIRNLEFLYSFSKAVSFTRDYRQLVQRILEGISQVLESGVCGFLLLENGSAHVAVRPLGAGHEGCAEELKGVLLREISALTGRVLNSRDVSLTEFGGPTQEAKRGDACALRISINVPFIVRDKVVGVISVASAAEDDFSARDAELVRSIAGDASDALERLQNVIADEKLRMESMVFSMIEGVIMFGEGGDLLVINPRAKELLGIAADRECGRDEIESRLELIDLISDIGDCVRRGDAVVKEVAVPGVRKSIVRVEVVPVKDPQGMPHGVVLVLRDVTKDVEIDNMKSEFVSIVSHEMRTPLSLTKEGISLVLDGITGEINERQQKCLKTAKGNIERLNRIIADLLDVSKIESGKIDLQITRFDIRDVINHVEEIFHERALDAGLELRKVLPAESIFVDADRDRLVQLFTNLIGNALKFTDKGFIEVSAKPDGKVVECSVTDSGIGIPESELPYVFDKFRQVGRVHGPGEKGTGLGLSIVKGILDMHGGSVQAKSEPGHGSRFIVRLPRVMA